MDMNKVLWEAFWEWLPGVVAGFLPLLVYAVALPFKPLILSAEHGALANHLLIFAIATSSVSVVTAFSRLVRHKIPNFLRDGRGPVALVILSIIILVYVVTVYALKEVGLRAKAMDLMAGLGLFASLVTSLYMEIAVARLHQLALARRSPRGAKKAA